MNFTVSLSGSVSVEAEASDLGLDLDYSANEYFDISSTVSLSDAEVTGTVNITARAEVEEVEVEVGDMSDYDADAALQEHVGPYVNVEDADFEVTSGPTGFDVVVEALGYDRDEAIKVYVALAAAGHEVI